MDNYGLFSKYQHGFRKGRSCVTQLILAMKDFTTFLDQGKNFDILYLDFRKAFDTVPHERLMVKLKSYEIDEKILSWIRDFLKCRSQVVRIGDSLSSEKPVLSGVPQGSIWGTLLFAMFINDLPDNINSKQVLFADDTKL